MGASEVKASRMYDKGDSPFRAPLRTSRKKKTDTKTEETQVKNDNLWQEVMPAITEIFGGKRSKPEDLIKPRRPLGPTLKVIGTVDEVARELYSLAQSFIDRHAIELPDPHTQVTDVDLERVDTLLKVKKFLNNLLWAQIQSKVTAEQAQSHLSVGSNWELGIAEPEGNEPCALCGQYHEGAVTGDFGDPVSALLSMLAGGYPR